MERSFINYYRILGFIIAITSCQNRTLSSNEYIQYCNNLENNLISKQVTDSFEYYLQFRTPEYMAIMEIGKNFDKQRLKSLINEYKGMEYYLLRIKSKYGFRKENINMQYMSFEFQKAIKMIGLDTITPALFQFENTQGISPYFTFSIGFDIVPDSLFDRSIVVNHFRNDQAVVFNFPKDIFQSLPKLKI